MERATGYLKETLKEKLKRVFLTERLNNPFGYVFFAVLSVLIALSISLDSSFGITTLVLIFFLPLVFGIVAYPKVGIITVLIAAYLIMFMLRLNFIDYPLGTFMDIIQALLILGFFIKQKYNPDWSIIKDPIGILVIIWVMYNVAQFANPTAESRLAWVYTIRSTAAVMLMYFIFTYHIRDIKFIRVILKLWLFMAFVAALYAFKQEHIGFFKFEELELNDPRLRRLLYIGGNWRKFSIFSDPVAFSYNMVTASIFCITMLFTDIKNWHKGIYIFLIGVYLYAMLLSGTRGAYVLIPASMILFAILKLNKKILIISIIGFGSLIALIYAPIGNQSIRRFQSAFKPGNDASFNVREINQARLQPYIRSHPFGGGLGATGAWGVRFSPNSYLAQFPPDSGYVRVAAELGWIGLLLLCTLFFVILRTGINNYFLIRDPELKTYCLAMVLIIFAYMIGNYPQEAIVQFPSNIFFYLFVGLITVTLKLDKKNQLANRDIV